MTYTQASLYRIRHALEKSDNIKAGSILSANEDSNMAFIEPKTNKCYVITIRCVDSQVEVVKAKEKKLMYSELIKQWGMK